MDSTTLERQLRLLLSWREKASQHLAAEAAAEENGDAGPDSFGRATLENHLVAVGTHIESMRADLRELIASRAEELRTRLAAQEQLVAQLGAGKLAPAAANERNRQLLREVQGLREELQALNTLQRAETAEDLGGFLDLPLEQYSAALAPQHGRAYRPAPARTAAPPTAAPGPAQRVWRENRLTLILAALVLAVGVMTILYLRVWRFDVEFQAFPPGEGGTELTVRCHNTTLQPVTWHVPWQAGRGARPRRDFGIDLYIREPGGAQYRHLPAPPEVWLREGQTMEGLEPVTVRARMHADVRLDLTALQDFAPPLESLRIVCLRGDGRVYLQYDLPLPAAE